MIDLLGPKNLRPYVFPSYLNCTSEKQELSSVIAVDFQEKIVVFDLSKNYIFLSQIADRSCPYVLRDF